jgi:DNA-binding CsgD family transcriptional regulator
MNREIKKLHSIWENSQQTSIINSEIPQLHFEDLVNSIISTGPFYYYIVDFFDMSISNVSPSIVDIHGLDPKTVTFNDILNTIHPDDMDFVAKAEAANLDFLYNTLGKEKICDYKSSFSFRSKMKNGEYVMLNHQALVLTVDKHGGFGKSLNIHTRIDHITKTNTNQISLIGLKGLPSFMNINVNYLPSSTIQFSKREISILKYISEGYNSQEIAEALFISILTVKKHRNNILQKSNCKNTTQLIKQCVLHGLL